MDFSWKLIPFYMLTFLAIAWGQFSLGNAFHDAVHFNFGAKHREMIAAFLTSYTIGLPLSYRKVHFAHHRYFGSDKDPDSMYYLHFPSSKVDFWKKILWYGSGLAAFKQFFVLNSKEESNEKKFDFYFLVLTQIFLLGLFTVFLGFPFYVLFWVLPIATVGKLFSYLRGLCEHGSPDKPYVYRTIYGSWYQIMTLGMFHFNYHMEHHLFPNVPCGNLRALHERVKNHVPEMKESLLEYYEGGYFHLLKEWYAFLPFWGSKHERVSL